MWWTEERMNEQTNERTTEWMNGWTDIYDGRNSDLDFNAYPQRNGYDIRSWLLSIQHYGNSGYGDLRCNTQN